MSESTSAVFSPQLGAVTLFTESVGGTRAFYADVLGLEVAFEDTDSVVFRFGDTVLNFLAVTAAPQLIGPARVAAPDTGSRFVFTVQVGDVDEVCRKLTERGVDLLNGPMDRPWGPRTASFVDPSGHIWEMAS